MLCDRLPGTERPRNCGRSALCDGEQAVEDALAGHKRLSGCALLDGRTSLTHRPLLVHRDVRSVGEFDHRLGDIERARLDGGDLGGLPLVKRVRRHHDLVVDGNRLLDDTDHVTAADLVAFLDGGVKLPLLFEVDAGRVDPSIEVRTAHLTLQYVQGTLNAVINCVQHPRTKVDRQRFARVLDGLTGADPGGLLIHLNRRDVALDLDDLPHESLVADVDDIVHAGVEIAGAHDRTAHALDDTVAGCLRGFCLAHVSSPLRPSGRSRWLV